MADSRDRQKRLAAKKRQRDRSRAKERRGRRLTSTQAKRPLTKVAGHEVHLRDGSSSAKYYAYWHIWVNAKRVGRVWLSHNPRSEEDPGVYITVEVNKSEQGHGIGQVAFSRAAELSNEDTVFGVSRKSNMSSIKAMENAGYIPAGSTKSGESRYVWKRSVVSRAIPSALACLSEDVDTSDHRIAQKDESTVVLSLREDHGIGKDTLAGHVYSRLFSANIPSISQFRRIHHEKGRTVCVSMVHSWALVGASYHLWRTGRIPRHIMHVDDHTDLDPCILFRESGTPVGRGQAPFILGEPATVTENLLRASFNKGSFLTAYLSLVDVSHVHHMCWTRRPMASAAISLVANCTQSVRARISGTGEIRFTSGMTMPQECFAPSKPLWLDIDLDAFCNRFNGDSNRRTLKASVGERRTLGQRLQETIREIHKCDLLRSAELVTVATSPGFCPSEYWEEPLRCLLDALGVSWSPFRD